LGRRWDCKPSGITKLLISPLPFWLLPGQGFRSHRKAHLLLNIYSQFLNCLSLKLHAEEESFPSGVEIIYWVWESEKNQARVS